MYHKRIEQFLRQANEYLDVNERTFEVILKPFCEQYPILTAEDLRAYNSFLVLQTVNSHLYYNSLTKDERQEIYEVHALFMHFIKIGDGQCDDFRFKIFPVERFLAESTVLSELRDLTDGKAQSIYLAERSGFSLDGRALFHPFETYRVLDKANIESTELLVHRDSLIRSYYSTISRSS